MCDVTNHSKTDLYLANASVKSDKLVAGVKSQKSQRSRFSQMSQIYAIERVTVAQDVMCDVIILVLDGLHHKT